LQVLDESSDMKGLDAGQLGQAVGHGKFTHDSKPDKCSVGKELKQLICFESR
jgi:hypothetical protein